MTSAYHAINMSNVNTLTDVLGVANQTTGGWFWAAMNLMIFLVILITLSVSFGWEAGFLSACFIGLIMSMLLLYMSLAPLWLVGFYVGGIIIMIIYIVWRNPYD